MSSIYYGFYVRMVSAGIYAATRRRGLVLQYFAAHGGALLLGTLVDVALVLCVIPRTGVSPAYMNTIFMAPIAFFVVFSIYICHRGTVMHAFGRRSSVNGKGIKFERQLFPGRVERKYSRRHLFRNQYWSD